MDDAKLIELEKRVTELEHRMMLPDRANLEIESLKRRVIALERYVERMQLARVRGKEPPKVQARAIDLVRFAGTWRPDSPDDDEES